jgi:hypothetical protein
MRGGDSMTRCIEFYEKWEKDPNFCELTKSEISRLDRYLGLVNELNDTYSVDQKLTNGNLSAGAVRELLTKENTTILEKLKPKLPDLIRRAEKKGRPITAKRVAQLIKQEKGETEPTPRTHETPEVVAPVETAQVDTQERTAEANDDSTGDGAPRHRADNETLDVIKRIEKDVLEHVTYRSIINISDDDNRAECWRLVESMRMCCDKALAAHEEDARGFSPKRDAEQPIQQQEDADPALQSQM